MKEIGRFFGDYKQIVQRRKYLKFTFMRSAGDETFWEKWNRTGGDILFRRQGIVEQKIVNYYVLSKQCLLSKDEQVTKQFQLPANSPIVEMCLIDPWVVIAG